MTELQGGYPVTVVGLLSEKYMQSYSDIHIVIITLYYTFKCLCRTHAISYNEESD